MALVGLSDHERNRLLTAFEAERAAGAPRYEVVRAFDSAGWLVADAEHTPSVTLVLAAERLKRTVWVGTPPPRGSVAGVDRPLVPQTVLEALDTLLGRERHGAAAGADATLPRRALLVDDSELALRFLETRLVRHGLVCERALSSNRAIERLAAARFDFVFVDLELGPASTLDGLALVRHIRRQRPKSAPAPVIVIVSAHDTPQHRALGDLAGCDAFLGKPLDEVALRRLLLRHGLKPQPVAG